MSGRMDSCRSRTVHVKSPVSPLAVIMFACALHSLFHNEPALASDGCPVPSFAVARTFETGFYPSCVVVADFNGDGKSDLALAIDSGIAVLLGNGDGTFQAAVSYRAGSGPTGSGASYLASGDFNGDGKLDLVVANRSSGNVSVLLGNGDGTFQSAVNYDAGIYPQSVAVADFNGDGKLDFAVANFHSGNVSVLLGKGDGTFQTPINYDAADDPHSVAVGDFNGDGKADLAVANLASSNVSVLLGNGDGTFQSAVNYGTAAGWSVAVGDFNGDGKADFAVAGYYDDNVSVLLGHGDGTFQAPVNYGAGKDPVSVAVADFNDDGKPDLAVANRGSFWDFTDGSVSVLLGNGNGSFQVAVNYGVGANAGSLAVADFNGDGKPDLALANSAGVGVLLGTTGGAFQAAVNY